MIERYTLSSRRKVMVNTDPQRRCYNGCHYSSEYHWMPWETLEHPTADRVEARLKFWRELNDYAVSQRGDGARCEFKAELEVPNEPA
jgi:hypothetical protein